MKKLNAYTIQDDIFMGALTIVHENFSDIPYALVGGGAVQVYISAVAIKHENVNSVKDLNGFSYVLRKTGDIDLSFLHDTAELIGRFNLIIQKSSSKYIFHKFMKRFVIQDGNQSFNINYQIEPSDLKGISPYYHDMVNSAITVSLPNRNENLSIKIARPEYLVASKLTRVKPKDQLDILLLLKAADPENYPFDSEEVRAILKSVGKGDSYDILRDLMDSG